VKLTHGIGLVLYPRISTINLAVATVFEMTNWRAEYPAYEITLVPEHGVPVGTSVGNKIQTVSYKRRAFDTILVAGEHNPAAIAPPGVVKYLSQSQHSTLLDLAAVSDRVQTVLSYAKQNLNKRLSVDELAAAA
jgi:transcriptional regulator GlxA family with amidase domain